MLNARKHAAPISAIECLVNNSADFYINSVPAQNLVIYAAQQFQDEAPIVDIRIWMGTAKTSELMIFSRETVFVTPPSFGLVLKHLPPMSFVVHVAPPTSANFENG
jgi:hypothetical protein